MAKMAREFHPHNYIINLRHGRDLNIADVNTSDPYVVVSSHKIAPSRSGGPKSAGVGGLLSFTKSKVIQSTLNPTWNEEVFVTCAEWNSQIVLTLMDSDMVGAHDFLGQVF